MTATHDESLEPPLISDHLVLEEIIGTAWHSIDRIVAAHDAGTKALANTCLKCWEIGLKIGCVCKQAINISLVSILLYRC